MKRGNLVLLRARGEAIVVYTPCGEMTIYVSNVSNKRARLALQAPESFTIMRTEVPHEPPKMCCTQMDCQAMEAEKEHE